jgi:hypothetical protein
MLHQDERREWVPMDALARTLAGEPQTAERSALTPKDQKDGREEQAQLSYFGVGVKRDGGGASGSRTVQPRGRAQHIESKGHLTPGAPSARQ